jgi:predicted dehydrogenase
MIKVGIIGLGFMSVAHIRGYRKLEDVEIVAICNPSGRRLNGDLSDVVGNVGDQSPVRLDMNRVSAYQSVDEFLQHPEMSVVDICTPTKTHLDLCRRSLERGFHVICEKPLGRTLADVESIREIATQSKGIFMPAMCLRFWPEWAWLKGLVDSGQYGRVQAAHFRRIAEPPAWGQSNYFEGAESGGALFDLHVHDVDFVHYCFGRPRQVYSTGFSKVSGAVDHVLTQYTFDSGACVATEGSWAMSRGFGFNMAYTVVFEQATADYDLSRGEERLQLCVEGKAREIVNCQGLDGHAAELEYFLSCVKAGKQPATVTIDDAVDVTRTCLAEEESVRSGAVVSLASGHQR